MCGDAGSDNDNVSFVGILDPEAYDNIDDVRSSGCSVKVELLMTAQKKVKVQDLRVRKLHPLGYVGDC